jgi:predicted nucleic acid-binding protein
MKKGATPGFDALSPRHQLVKPAPSQSLMAWMAERADEDLFIAALTVAEISRGILEKPAGKRRIEMEAWFAGPEGPQALFQGRVLAFDETAEADACMVVTANEKDFEGIEILNPLRKNE